MRITKEFSREELMTMPLVALRRLDIDTPSQQSLVQEIVNIKLTDLPPQRPVYRKDVPDIRTIEQEKEWQEVMRQREAKIKGIVAETPVVSPEIPEVPVEVPVEPVAEPVVTPVPATSPDEAGMAEPSGEGEAVTISTGVSNKLVGKRKSKK